MSRYEGCEFQLGGELIGCQRRPNSNGLCDAHQPTTPSFHVGMFVEVRTATGEWIPKVVAHEPIRGYKFPVLYVETNDPTWPAAWPLDDVRDP